jgi:hypothetical protein
LRFFPLILYTISNLNITATCHLCSIATPPCVPPSTTLCQVRCLCCLGLPDWPFHEAHIVTGWNDFHQVYREKTIEILHKLSKLLYAKKIQIYINVQLSYYAIYFLPTTMNYQLT